MMEEHTQLIADALEIVERYLNKHGYKYYIRDDTGYPTVYCKPESPESNKAAAFVTFFIGREVMEVSVHSGWACYGEIRGEQYGRFLEFLMEVNKKVGDCLFLYNSSSEYIGDTIGLMHSFKIETLEKVNLDQLLAKLMGMYLYYIPGFYRLMHEEITVEKAFACCKKTNEELMKSEVRMKCLNREELYRKMVDQLCNIGSKDPKTYEKELRDVLEKTWYQLSQL